MADFSRVVYKSKKSESLFTYDAIISMCTLETLQLKNVPQYSELCESKVTVNNNILAKTMFLGRDKIISFFQALYQFSSSALRHLYNLGKNIYSNIYYDIMECTPCHRKQAICKKKHVGLKENLCFYPHSYPCIRALLNADADTKYPRN